LAIARDTLNYREAALSGSGDRFASDVLDNRERRRFTPQFAEKSFEFIQRALDLDNDSTRIISHRTAKT
jgi:predicted nucleic acid-binding OB-fold protein